MIIVSCLEKDSRFNKSCFKKVLTFTNEINDEKTLFSFSSEPTVLGIKRRSRGQTTCPEENSTMSLSGV